MNPIEEQRRKTIEEGKLLKYAELVHKNYSALSPEKYKAQIEVTVKVLMSIGADEDYARYIIEKARGEQPQ